MGKKYLSPRDLEQISAYLDGELSLKDKANLEKRLWSDPEWRNALDEIDRTRLMLRSLPRVRAPRNFTLSPEYARKKAAPRLYPLFGFASALATVILLVVLVADWMGVGLTPVAGLLPVEPSDTVAPFMPESLAVEIATDDGTVIPTEPLAAAMKIADTSTPEPSPTSLASETALVTETTILLEPTATPELVILAVTDAPTSTATGREITMDVQDTLSPTPSATATEAPSPKLPPTDTHTPEPTVTSTPLPTDTAIPTETPAPTSVSVTEIAQLAAPNDRSAETVMPEVTPEHKGQDTPYALGEQPAWLMLESGLVLLALLMVAAALWNYRQRIR